MFEVGPGCPQPGLAFSVPFRKRNPNHLLILGSPFFPWWPMSARSCHLHFPRCGSALEFRNHPPQEEKQMEQTWFDRLLDPLKGTNPFQGDCLPGRVSL